MSSQTFVNIAGTRYLSEERNDKLYQIQCQGTGYPVVNSVHVDYGSVDVSVSRKWGVQRGDHKTPQSWFRNWGNVVTDVPYSVSQFDANSSVGYWLSQMYVKYISRKVYALWAGEHLLYEGDNCVAESVVKALNHLSSEKATLGADLAQAKQTADMFAGNVTKGVEFFRAFKKRDMASALRALGIRSRNGKSRATKAYADMWLEVNYGWVPLATSIYETQKVLCMEMAKDRIIRGTGKGKARRGRDYEWGSFNIRENAKTSARTEIHARLETETLAFLNSLGVVNPLTVAWEVVPWSFAVDWFIPVGNVLEAASAHFGLEFVKGWTSVKSDSHASAYHNGKYMVPGLNLVDPGQYLEVHGAFQRFAYATFPRPQFYADLTPFSTPRVLNALALVRQLFK